MRAGVNVRLELFEWQTGGGPEFNFVLSNHSTDPSRTQSTVLTCSISECENATRSCYPSLIHSLTFIGRCHSGISTQSRRTSSTRLNLIHVHVSLFLWTEIMNSFTPTLVSDETLSKLGAILTEKLVIAALDLIDRGNGMYFVRPVSA